MAIAEEDRMKFVNEVGTEAFNLIIKRMEALGEVPFSEMFHSVSAASAVCFANVLRPAIERARDRASAADSLISVTMKQVRALVDPVVKGDPS